MTYGKGTVQQTLPAAVASRRAVRGPGAHGVAVRLHRHQRQRPPRPRRADSQVKMKNGRYDAPEKFTDRNGNGRWDAGEPFIDANQNGRYDAGEPFTDDEQERPLGRGRLGQGHRRASTSCPTAATSRAKRRSKDGKVGPHRRHRARRRGQARRRSTSGSARRRADLVKTGASPSLRRRPDDQGRPTLVETLARSRPPRPDGLPRLRRVLRGALDAPLHAGASAGSCASACARRVGDELGRELVGDVVDDAELRAALRDLFKDTKTDPKTIPDLAFLADMPPKVVKDTRREGEGRSAEEAEGPRGPLRSVLPTLLRFDRGSRPAPGTSSTASPTRAGGVSRGRLRVAQPRPLRRATTPRPSPRTAAASPRRSARPSPLRFPRQVHGRAWSSLEDAAADDLRAADARRVRPRPGALVGVLGADCPGVLLVDPERRALAVVHAGWRGTSRASSPRRSTALVRAPRRRPRATCAPAIGPGISAARYEVGPEVGATLPRRLRARGRRRRPRPPGTAAHVDLAARDRDAARARRASPRRDRDAPPLHVRRDGRASSPTAATAPARAATRSSRAGRCALLRERRRRAPRARRALDRDFGEAARNPRRTPRRSRRGVEVFAAVVGRLLEQVVLDEVEDHLADVVGGRDAPLPRARARARKPNVWSARSR